MREAYEKPMFRLETFSLTQNIAVDCGVPHKGNEYGQHRFADAWSCYWDDGFGGKIWFDPALDEGTVCTTYVREDEQVSGMCYNNPEGMMSAFGS